MKLSGRGLNAAKAHLRYIQRDGVTPQGEPGQLYSANLDHAEGKDFLKRCEHDRHQFRFIVAAEDSAEYQDLKPLIRRLMARMEADLDTKLDWVAVDHYNTEHPHTHVLLRGKDDRGRDLVIARNYMSKGMRERAIEIVTLDLGPQSDLELIRKLQREVDQERFTSLDRSLLRDAEAGSHRIALRSSGLDPARHALRTGRLRKLQRLGLARESGPGQWTLDLDLEDRLRELGSRGDIIKTLNRELRAMGLERSLSDLAIAGAGGSAHEPIVGRVLRKGLADELNDGHYLILDGADGRLHYIDLGRATPSDPIPQGAIVTARPHSLVPRRSDHSVHEVAAANGGQYSIELHLRHDPTATAEFAETHVRRLEAIRRVSGGVTRRPDGVWLIDPDHLERAREYERARAKVTPMALQILSIWSLDQQVSADGPTWLDKELVSGAPVAMRDAGFGKEARQALTARRQWLLQHGLAREEDGRFVCQPNLLATLRQRELARTAAQLSGQLGLNYVALQEGEEFSGVFRQRLDLRSGPFVAVQSGRSFMLVPWRSRAEPVIGSPARGRATASGADWMRDQHLIPGIS